MAFEIDFLPVEAGEKSGDAITARIWLPNGQWFVLVIDGGYADDGDAVVEHINKHYGTNTVNLAVSTHPDRDHAGGLVRVLERMKVHDLWMHRPWTHPNLTNLFKNDRVTAAGIRRRLSRDLEAAKAVEAAALKNKVRITEPFVGIAPYLGMVYVLGPTKTFYTAQLAHFDCTPDPVLPVPQRRPLGILETLYGPQAKREDWASETLEDECSTSAENNSSVILGVTLKQGQWAMFTGDAGDTALTSALNVMDVNKVNREWMTFVQIPHHGSEHNISPAVLNRWLGMPQLYDQQTRTAYVSSAFKAPKHPSEKVMNAFRRRGAWPFATEGQAIYHASPDAPARDGWTVISPYPFYQGVA